VTDYDINTRKAQTLNNWGEVKRYL